MGSAEEVASSGLRGKLREVQRVCEVSSEAVLTTIVEVIKLAREVIGIKRNDATMADGNTDK